MSHHFPVSVKGVVLRGDKVVLLYNERDEWELPGGKLDPEESPEQCVVREIQEELDLDVAVDALLDAWVYTIFPGACVLIVTYGCVERTEREIVLSHEHKKVAWFPVQQVTGLPMPEGYKRSLYDWAKRRGLAE